MIKILITGDNGESLPPPYGGIIKRCLLHAKIWRSLGAKVFLHVYSKHQREEDLGAKAEYFYDFLKKPTILAKIAFIILKFFISPILFLKLLFRQIFIYPEFKISRFLYCAARGVLLNKEIEQIDPQIIITETGGLQSLISLEIAKLHSLPIVLENYAEIQYSDAGGGINAADKYSRLWRYLLGGVDLVVPASQHCSLGPSKYLADKSKIEIVYSGINFKVFNGIIGVNDKLKNRQKFALPQNKFLVMAVGALKMRKGHDQLFEALLKLPVEILAKVTVILCGMGNVDQMFEKAKELGFDEDSLKIFQGLTEEDLAVLYSCADCFCFPSITPRECMGMAMKEAMALGLPVVAYNAGGIKEAISSGVNGILVPAGDRQALSQGIRQIIDMNEEQRREIKQNNIIKARDLFDIEKTAEQLYQKITTLVK